MTSLFKPPSRAVPQTQEATAGATTPCVSHRRVCGDSLIEEHIPGYFDTHARTPLGQEAQYCVLCGHVLIVARYAPAYVKRVIRR